MVGIVQDAVTVVAACVEMPNQVSSSDKSTCENGCVEFCSNLYHYPPIEGQLLVAYQHHQINISCLDCFHSFMFNLCILLTTFCSITRTEILSSRFIIDSLALYDQLFEHFKLCIITHGNTPPEYECISCSKRFMVHIFDFCDRWFVRCFSININITLLQEILIKRWIACENGCYSNILINRNE